jgi:hypothetical protein
MQGNWVNMVYEQEVTPPADAWEAIAMSLDEARHTPHWQQRVYHAEEAPPAECWQSIAVALDRESGSGWLGKLYQQEETPPAECWQPIAAALDREWGSGWLGKVYQQEEAPPADAWELIAARLTESPLDETVPMLRPVRRMKLLRMAAAAVTVAAVAGTVWWATNRTFSGDDPQTVAVNTPPANTSAIAPTNPSPPANTEVPTTDLAAVEPAAPAVDNVDKAASTVPSPPRNSRSATNAVRTVAASETLEYAPGNEMTFLPTDAVLQNTRKLPNDRGETVVDINSLEVPNSQYVMISGPDGRSMRVSAKFVNLLGYLNEGPENEERLDRIIRESAVWKATFRQWREKMVHANATPSLNNFMDVVELAKMLQ